MEKAIMRTTEDGDKFVQLRNSTADLTLLKVMEEKQALLQSNPGKHFIPRGVQGQVGWRSEQPDLVKGVPAYGRGVGTRWSLRFLSAQAIL